MLSLDNFRQEQEIQIRTTAKKLQLSMPVTRILLRHFNWNAGNLFHIHFNSPLETFLEEFKKEAKNRTLSTFFEKIGVPPAKNVTLEDLEMEYECPCIEMVCISADSNPKLVWMNSL